jgi:hypothetical protein
MYAQEQEHALAGQYGVRMMCFASHASPLFAICLGLDSGGRHAHGHVHHVAYPRRVDVVTRVSVQVGVSPYLMSREMKQNDSMKLEVNNCY